MDDAILAALAIVILFAALVVIDHFHAEPAGDWAADADKPIGYEPTDLGWLDERAEAWRTTTPVRWPGTESTASVEGLCGRCKDQFGPGVEIVLADLDGSGDGDFLWCHLECTRLAETGLC